MTNYPAMTNETPGASAREGSTDHVLAVFEDFRKRIEGVHVPAFLNIDITMSQAKILRLLDGARELRMAELVRRLGTSLSTVSGHVERLVEQGLVERRDDPADRRQVLVAPTPAAAELAERFRELNATQLRRLLDRMTRPERLDVVRAFNHITRAIERGERTDPEPDPRSKG
jgi:DNA-binding MarR family transcriptional regulator